MANERAVAGHRLTTGVSLPLTTDELYERAVQQRRFQGMLAALRKIANAKAGGRGCAEQMRQIARDGLGRADMDWRLGASLPKRWLEEWRDNSTADAVDFIAPCDCGGCLDCDAWERRRETALTGDGGGGC